MKLIQKFKEHLNKIPIFTLKIIFIINSTKIIFSKTVKVLNYFNNQESYFLVKIITNY